MSIPNKSVMNGIDLDKHTVHVIHMGIHIKRTNYFLDFMTDIFLIDRSMLVNKQGEITKHPLIGSYCVTVIPIGLTVNTRETGMTILLLLWRDSYNQKY